MATPSLSHDDYTVAWICALPLELAAAKAMLDETHALLYQPLSDHNTYAFGRLGAHNIVIACLPFGVYGITPAATVLAQTLSTFPSLRFSLMVGIGGGVPKHDIRLGDVVVSKPTGTCGGVIQYDYGKTVRQGKFERIGSLNKPPQILLTALAQMESDQLMKRRETPIKDLITRTLEKYPEMNDGFARPQNDWLYAATYDHAGSGPNCSLCDPKQLVDRPPRSTDEPFIHHGLIASGNQVIKDARKRDQIAEEFDILCFEMEAAALMDQFPCLVIRGICDYSDTHKNNEWQGYAALAAAAYATLLLLVVPAPTPQSKPKSPMDDKYREYHQLFRLVRDEKDNSYEWYKDQIEYRVEGTCQWFLTQPCLETWMQQETGILVVTADPGCGKSVLAKYLIDHWLPKSTAICYFFFKDQDQNTLQQAVCAILHQLFIYKPSLLRHVEPEYNRNGNGSKLVNIDSSLINILENTGKDSEAGSVIFVLDALDECKSSELEKLIKLLRFRFYQRKDGFGKVKFLLTSRPYGHIMSEFKGLTETFPYIHIPGENQSESIGREVNEVIKYRVSQLAKEKRLSPDIGEHLEQQLLGIPHRTYLWAHLVFDFLKKHNFRKTKKGIEIHIKELPKNVNDAYESILDRSSDTPMARKALCIILAARRPLTLREMNIALNIENTSESIEDIDLEADDDFAETLRNLCGLFVLVHDKKIYFLHQTAREFLLCKDTADVGHLSVWSGSIYTQAAESILAVSCIVYIRRLMSARERYFLDYSAGYWAEHFRNGCTEQLEDMLPLALDLCGYRSYNKLSWFEIYWDNNPHTYGICPRKITPVWVAAYFGLEKVLQKLLSNPISFTMQFDAYYDQKDDYGQTPLSRAAEEGHEAVVALLLDRGSDIESKDEDHRTPLSWAAENGREAVVALLLDRGADIESKDQDHWTPLSRAAEGGHETVVALLLDRGADVESKDQYHQTPLSWAAVAGYEAIVVLLLDRGANIESKDQYYQTPLSWAAENGYRAVVALLLDRGADVESQDQYHRTPLSWAARNGYETVVALLLDRGADIESKDWHCQTPLSRAAMNGYETVVALLLERGADIESKDWHCQTPLSWAAENGHEAVVALLLDRGADIESKNQCHWTPLCQAAQGGHEAVVALLLDRGADIESKDHSHRTPLFWAAQGGREAVVALLLDRGADIESKDQCHWTPLCQAAQGGHEAVVALLLDRGAGIESKDHGHRTPLFWAAQGGHEAVVALLLDRGADIESKDQDHRTPLSRATARGHEAVVALLLDGGADIESKDHGHRTPLRGAVERGYEAVVALLLDRGADIESKDQNHRTPLSWAAARGYEDIVALLLDRGADIESKDQDHQTPLSRAAENGHETVVALLLHRGADVESKDWGHRTPLSRAAEGGYETIVAQLLDGGANVESKNQNHRTPLSWAAARGYEAVVALLLDRGADIESKNGFHQTPLCLAAEKGHKAVVALLLDRGADIESKNGFHQTPLSLAAKKGHEAVVALLVDRGADIESEHEYYQTPLSWAAARGHEAVVALLLDSSADVESKDE